MAEQGIKDKGGRGAFADLFKFIKDSRTLLISSVLIFIFSTLIAFRQEPRPDAYTQPEFPSVDWWKYPIEKNAVARLPVVSYGKLNGVFALPNSEKVWVAGDGGLIAHSNDGGKTWERQYPPIEQDDVKDVNQQNEQVGIGFSLSKTVYAQQLPVEQRTPAKGASRFQERRNLETEDLKKQKELNILEQKQKQIPDAEVSPTPTPKPEVSDSDKKEKKFNDLQSIFFTDANNGWAVGSRGAILHTTDGGKNWNQESKTHQMLISVTFTDADNGWAVGVGTILHTTDGGKNWNTQASKTPKWLNSVTFTDTNNGWAVGGSGTILHTIDGGINWNKQNSNTPLSLGSVTFTDADNGWAVGPGTILHTTDGGKNWAKLETPLSLYSVTFIDANNGWTVGMNGTVLHTTDGGRR